MTKDELAVMDGGKCILQLRGVRPFLNNTMKKVDMLFLHVNFHLTGSVGEISPVFFMKPGRPDKTARQHFVRFAHAFAISSLLNNGCEFSVDK